MKVTSAWIAVATLAAGMAMHSSTASAAIVFSDDFNGYSGQLNWIPPTNWSITSGSVDLIGETPSGTSFDFYPGNGGYVDLNGTTGSPGTLQTLASFAAGTYTLSFALGGNARGDGPKTTVVTLGTFSQPITLAASDPLAIHSFTFTTSGGNLSFADLLGGNGNIGNILDNVAVAAVPESSSWAMVLLGFASVGLLVYRRRAPTFRVI
ncbi:PEP-CTERM sorting domain-containing protein [Bradyrhizobium sp.]|uniref:PEP-CTERM sorting domain-containing protein n=1 Tax=Bradyrhizobium sp. TaxID=376 RepID=UPI002382A12F|nr:PEP-CTERM sorting domain-containing protein [Bradyrhizobium sp.]MDE2379551.1 PEP-CTERM sorting domain-containing protein [Bradyrhizobium sp.]